MEFFLWNVCEWVRAYPLGAEYTFFSPLTPGLHHHITRGVDLLHKERESISGPDYARQRCIIQCTYISSQELEGATFQVNPPKPTYIDEISAISKPLKECLGGGEAYQFQTVCHWLDFALFDVWCVYLRGADLPH